MLDACGVARPASSIESLHEHNEAARVAELVERVAAGQTVALVSDAGTPLVSDPGYLLVRAARQAGLKTAVMFGPLLPFISVLPAMSAIRFDGMTATRVLRSRTLPL